MKYLFPLLLILAIVAFSIANSQVADTHDSSPVAASTTEQDDNPFQEKCYTCHGDEVAYKEWMHSSHSKALTNLRHGDHPPRDSCLSCHSSGYATLIRHPWPEERPFNLETAVNAVACSSCHLHRSEREHYLVMSPKKVCVSCHKMDCGCAGSGVIHQSQSEMFLGRFGLGVRRNPSPHVKAMKKRCVHCHMAKKEPDTIARSGGHTFRADFSICADCHDDMTAKMKEYRSEIEAKMHAVEVMLDSAPDQESEVYQSAKWNYDMVKGDGGYGLHNIEYANALLDYSLSLKPQLVETKSEAEEPSGGE